MTKKEQILEKAKKVQSKKIEKEQKYLNSLQEAVQKVKIALEKYDFNFECITSLEDLTHFVDFVTEKRDTLLAYDTETTGLNPVDDKAVGISFAALQNGEIKSIYIPFLHTKPISKELQENQLTYEQVKPYLKKMFDNCLVIGHNLNFDVRVVKWNLGIDIPSNSLFWDTQIAANCLNENEEHGLKYLWNYYCNKDNTSDENPLKFEGYFKKIDFREIPKEIASLYGAFDSVMTFEVFLYQTKFLSPTYIGTDSRYAGISSVFHTIEMPCLYATIEMENNGVKIDTEFAKQLSLKYQAEQQKALDTFNKLTLPYKEKLEEYSVTFPVNPASPKQLGILIYDILKTKIIDNKNPRGTGKEVLEKIKHPVCEAILNYRNISKLLSTYVDKLPTCVSPKTNRLHTTFNQYGAKTGRFSSSEPNLQNIPSQNKEIRKMFVASEGCLLIGGDFSQQEPRTLASLSNETEMIKAYKEGKDIYSWIASLIYHVDYEDCKEFRPDGTKNEKGTKRRKTAKAIVLGLTYSKGVKAVAEDLKITLEEANYIFNTFFLTFPKLKDFIEQAQLFAKQNLYVTTAWGRKRRLVDLGLPKYEISNVEGVNIPLTEECKKRYISRLNRVWKFEDKQEIIAEAQRNGIKIVDNNMKIAKAERECVNSIIQGSAADMVKIALVKICHNEELKKLGFKTLLTIHDEIIGEAPKENAQRASQLLSQLMIESAVEKVTVPMKVDTEITERWYGDTIEFEEEE